MEEIKVINGKEYKFEVTENEILAREIRKLNFAGYKIAAVTDCYSTEFYKIFGNEKKLIGKLIYNPANYIFSLWKILKSKNHIMNVTNEVGVNGAIFSKLRVGDYLYFKIDKKTYKIRVGKAIQVGNYKNFEGTAYNSELQFFIPLSELTELESKKTGRKRNKRRPA